MVGHVVLALSLVWLGWVGGSEPGISRICICAQGGACNCRGRSRALCSSRQQRSPLRGSYSGDIGGVHRHGLPRYRVTGSHSGTASPGDQGKQAGPDSTVILHVHMLLMKHRAAPRSGERNGPPLQPHLHQLLLASLARARLLRHLWMKTRLPALIRLPSRCMYPNSPFNSARKCVSSCDDGVP